VRHDAIHPLQPADEEALLFSGFFAAVNQ